MNLRQAWLPFLLMLAPVVAAGDDIPAPLDEVRIEQRLGSQLSGDLVFRDERGQPVRLGTYFGDRPVILVLAYFRCPRLCSLALQGLVDSSNRMPLAAGRDYQVLVVSFDHREGPAIASGRKQVLLEQLTRPGEGAGWTFLTGKQAAIKKLADEVGFRYVYDSSRDEFRHASAIMLLTPEGKVARYLFGVDYPPSALRLGLVEASENRIGSPVDRVLLLTCLAYDPASGKYLISPMRLMRLGAALTVAFLLIYVARQLIRERRARRAVPMAPRMEDA